MNFTKHDSGKLQYSQLEPEFLRGITAVLTMGAIKYDRANWKKNTDPTRYIDALYRHLEAWRAGEEIDHESGESHLAHAAANIMFLRYYDVQTTEKKD